MTRCPKCGQEGVHPRDSSCIPEADAPIPAPSLLDFNRARKAGGVTFYSPGPQLVAEEADLNAQAAALVETARREERRGVLQEVYSKWLVASEDIDDFIEWLTNERRKLVVHNQEARDDHR